MKTPDHTVRMGTEVKLDRPSRTIRATVATETLADDGGVVLVSGLCGSSLIVACLGDGQIPLCLLHGTRARVADLLRFPGSV